MRLFSFSVIFGLLGLVLGGLLNNVLFLCIFGFLGFFSPIIFVLDSIYEEIVRKDKKI